MVAALGIPAAVAGGIEALGGLLKVLDPIINRLLPDPEKATELRNALIATLAQSDIAQLRVNEAEAATGNLFISGWRPFIGWCCGLGFAYTVIIAPLTEGFTGYQMPTASDHLWEVMFGILGMGALKSFDKFAGTETKRVTLRQRDPTTLVDRIKGSTG